MEYYLKIISTYWSQITILLLALGYLLKLYLNYLTKKKEINHSLFQKMMMDSVYAFYNSYSQIEELWRDLPLLRIKDGQYSPKELDDMIFPFLNDIKNRSVQLRLFFEVNEIKLFEKIVSNFYVINSKVSEIYMNHQTGVNYINASVDYENLKDQITTDNSILINQISAMIRKKFK